MLSKKIYLYLIFCFNLAKISAQTPKIFQHFDSKDGLSSDVVTAICRDRQGYLWIGTDYGLNRFDGYTFTLFLPDNQLQNKTISSEKINDIKEDENGNLWIATEAGLFRYDQNHKTFQRWLNTGRDDGSIPNSLITNILPDNEKIWLCCDNRDICYYDTQNAVFKSFAWKNFVNQIIPSFKSKNYKTIYYLKRKSATELWLVTNLGLFSFDIKNEQFRYYDFNLLKPTKPKPFAEKSVCEETFFQQTFDDDFYYLDFCKNEIAKFQLPISPDLKGGERTVNHIEKVGNDYWILARQGLFFMENNTLKINEIKPNFSNNSTAPIGNIDRFFKEKNGTIWLGGEKGLWQYVPDNQHFEYFSIYPNERKMQYNPFSKVCYSKIDGRTYIGDFYAGKVFVYDREKLVKIIKLPSWRSALLFEDRQGNLWCNADTRLFIINRNSLTINEFKISKELKIHQSDKAYFTDMCEDSNGNLWCATSEQWVFVYDISTKKWPKPTINDNYQPLAVTSLLADNAKKTIWIGTQDYGLLRYDEVSKNFTLFQHDDKNPTQSIAGFVVMDIEKDAKGNIWVATSPGGLSQFDEKTQHFHNFTTLQGLPSNLVNTLFLDAKGNIWGGTNRGLFCVQKGDFNIRTFNQKNGLFSDFIDTQLSKWQDGRIAISHKNSLQLFSPDSLLKENILPKILINNFKVFDKNICDTLNINNLTNGISLKWSDNFFSFEFSSTDFNLSEKNEYAYRLVGFDKDWVYCGKRHSATYTNVPSGEYILEIKTGREGRFQDIGFRLPIFIATPFWQTAWFKLLIFCFLVGVIYSIYRYRIAQIQKEEKLKTEFNERLAKVEMNALRAQMNPHFVFNCLSSINRFILVNQPDEASNYLTKFSRLIRLILDNSRNENVTLDKELEALRLYIDMEAMRFNNRFTYSIDIEDDIQAEHLEVPPLLIQPYVENAIWHGLMHLEKEGKLHIHVFYDQETLCINIEDNGIGRAKAAELKSKSATSQKSHGMQVTAARIDIINQLYNTNNQVFITDLYNEKGEASGTRVELRLS